MRAARLTLSVLILAAALVSPAMLRAGRADDAQPAEPDRDAATQPAGAVPAKKPGEVRVAGIVLKWVLGDKEANYARVEPLIREAARGGADIVVTTECFLDGYAIRDKKIPLERWREIAEPIPDGPCFKKIAALADELNIHLVAGMVERDGDETFNTAVYITPDGRLLGKYHKQSLGHESPRNCAGTASPVFETEFGRIGLMICADRREPHLIKRLGDQKVDLILCPSGGMWGPIKNDFHLQARSVENNVPIVFVHPIEFLVTDRSGAIIQRRFIGDRMDAPSEAKPGNRHDGTLVAYQDLRLR